LNRRNIMIIGLILVGVGAVFLFVNLHTMYRWKKFDEEGVKTTGTVVKQWTHMDDKRRSVYYWLRLSYQAQDGSTHELSESMVEDLWKKSPEGSTMEVVYLPSQPDRANIVGGTRKQNFLVQNLIAIALIAGGIVLLFLKRGG